VLADGTKFRGFSIGASGHTVGEVVFNTSMTGYQEIISDPSYAEQIISFTYPHIGNVGINEEILNQTEYIQKVLLFMTYLSSIQTSDHIAHFQNF
jgi:carbamoyl-phosphate synthase small subunit